MPFISAKGDGSMSRHSDAKAHRADSIGRVRQVMEYDEAGNEVPCRVHGHPVVADGGPPPTRRRSRGVFARG